ncbi:MAG: hypothetical protein JSU63_05170 [Phycisphaerales bacterium]|nr:MAG: hypothetical protein JSU63_05170 [Phycisphaerales bacterium]
MVRRCVLAACVMLLTPPSAMAGGAVTPPSTDSRPVAGELAAQVELFFHTENAGTRSRIAATIAEASRSDFQAVARAVAEVSLWSELPAARNVVPLESAAFGTVDVVVSLPDGYDPSQRYPLLVCVPGEPDSADEALALAEVCLDKAVEGFVKVSPQHPFDSPLGESPPAAADLPAFLRHLRKLIHTDTNRIFLFGAGHGGDSAWLVAIAYPDCFAGLITLSAYPRWPYPRQTLPLALKNLTHLPVLTAWQVVADRDKTPRQVKVAAFNSGIAEFAKRAGLPITGLALAEGVSLELPQPQLAAILNHKRVESTQPVSHWFRCPAQGRSGWIRQTKQAGEVWDVRQLSILSSPSSDHDRFVREVFEENLAYIGGRIDGQIINVDTRRCARVELLLPATALDWSKPVTIRCNGRKRYEGLLRPSIETMLEAAYEQWEFQCPVAVRKAFSIGADAGGGR